MDFKDSIQQLAERISKQRESIGTEEATKNAFIMPLIATLGYDPFDPFEVVPEYTCDVGIKKGEKIDYAIMREGKPVLLIECKHCGQMLDNHDSQLIRYFSASNVRFAILTNGVKYRFYTDQDKSNIMDNKPFLDIDILDLKDNQIEELKKFHKSYFNESNILSTASELKTSTALKEVLQRELTSPSQEFVRYFVREINDGKSSAKQVEQCTPLLKKSIQGYINDVITARLSSAASLDDIKNTQPDSGIAPTEQLPEGVVAISEDGGVITTQEEIDAYNIVKGILRRNIPASRITYKDNKTYFSVTIDGFGWKWICRLYLKKHKYISFPSEKGEEKIEIQSIDEIFDHSDSLIKSLTDLMK